MARSHPARVHRDPAVELVGLARARGLHMPRPRSRGYRILMLSEEAWTAAEKLGRVAGVSADTFVEGVLLELFLNHPELNEGARQAPLAPPIQPQVIPISRASKGRRGRSPLPPAV